MVFLQYQVPCRMGKHKASAFQSCAPDIEQLPGVPGFSSPRHASFLPLPPLLCLRPGVGPIHSWACMCWCGKASSITDLLCVLDTAYFDY